MNYQDMNKMHTVNFDNQMERVLLKLGQLDMLGYLHTLPAENQKKMLDQLATLDLSVLSCQDTKRELHSITPCFTLKREQILEKEDELTAIGTKAIREGKLAAVMLAGGQGSRLGFNQPKGTVNIGVDVPLYIFECQIINLLTVCNQVGCYIPLFIMTSDGNHEETVSFMHNHGCFGYPAEFIWFFKQEQLPVLDVSGNLMLADKDTILTAPNGNGGWYSSLASSGLLKVIKNQGIEWLNVFAVDNVLQQIADPCFFGAVLEKNWKCGAKVVKKKSPDEHVGTLCVEDGSRPTIVEYYEMTDTMRYAKDVKGEYIFNYGVILNYLFRVDQLDNTLDVSLPLHRATKKVNYQTFDGEKREDYACKFETLALDLINLQGECLPFEVSREREFAPIKNKEGPDSIETARELLKLNGYEL